MAESTNVYRMYRKFWEKRYYKVENSFTSGLKRHPKAEHSHLVQKDFNGQIAQSSVYNLQVKAVQMEFQQFFLSQHTT